MDPKYLKTNHWNIGEENKNAPDQFDTIYKLTMYPKSVPLQEQAPNKTFKTSINLTGDGKGEYSTENKSNYIPLLDKLEPKDLNKMNKLVDDIKNSHFIFGESPGDFQTINGNTYKYDPSKAADARHTLDKGLLNDLRSTHYKLGYQDECGKSTHETSYVPIDINFKAADDPNLRKSHFNFGDEKSLIHQKDLTIYQTDYIKKPLPKEEDYFY